MNPASVPEPATDRRRHRLEGMGAEERVRWALESLPGPFVVTSSFGVQSPVLLHLASRIQPDWAAAGFSDSGIG
jgi:phosphoadenosine phosphosulfate reductase